MFTPVLGTHTGISDSLDIIYHYLFLLEIKFFI